MFEKVLVFLITVQYMISLMNAVDILSLDCDGLSTEVWGSTPHAATSNGWQCPSTDLNDLCCITSPVVYATSTMTTKAVDATGLSNLQVIIDVFTQIPSAECQVMYSIDGSNFISVKGYTNEGPLLAQEIPLPSETYGVSTLYLRLANTYIGADGNDGQFRCFWDNIIINDQAIQHTDSPSESPSIKLTTEAPTDSPSKSPSKLPSKSPFKKLTTKVPTESSSKSPSKNPSKNPTESPSKTASIPHISVTENPMDSPSHSPSKSPSTSPSKASIAQQNTALIRIGNFSTTALILIVAIVGLCILTVLMCVLFCVKSKMKKMQAGIQGHLTPQSQSSAVDVTGYNGDPPTSTIPATGQQIYIVNSNHSSASNMSNNDNNQFNNNTQVGVICVPMSEGQSVYAKQKHVIALHCDLTAGNVAPVNGNGINNPLETADNGENDDHSESENVNKIYKTGTTGGDNNETINYHNSIVHKYDIYAKQETKGGLTKGASTDTESSEESVIDNKNQTTQG